LHEEERSPDIDGEEFVKVFDRRFLNGRRFRDPCIRHKDVETVAHDGPDLLGEPLRTVRCGEISGDSIGAAAGFADLSDDGFRFLRAASVMDEHLGAGSGERQCAGAPDAARGAGDESRLS
jgi:hypothetical protein